ncbi:hypothetical protein ILUMI_18292, partial [Ignelater luminosus]
MQFFRLHFRPKTPPPDYEPPCHLLPADDDTFIPSANTPFTLEIQTLEAPSSLLDTSTFLTTPFTLEDLCPISTEVPVTDTRQFSDTNVQTGINLNVNVGLNTLTPSVNDSFTSNINLIDSDCTVTCDTNSVNSGEDRTIGCSMFNVSNISESADESSSKNRLILSNTLTSPKLNSVNIPIENRIKSGPDIPVSNANGLLTQFGFE